MLNVYIIKRNWNYPLFGNGNEIVPSKIEIAYSSEKKAIESLYEELKQLVAMKVLSKASETDAKVILSNNKSMIEQYKLKLRNGAVVRSEIEKKRVF